MARLNFPQDSRGEIISETMLVRSVNDNEANLIATARFLRKLDLGCAYLAAPTRPPSEKWVESPNEYHINTAYQIFKAHIQNVELLLGFSG